MIVKECHCDICKRNIPYNTYRIILVALGFEDREYHLCQKCVNKLHSNNPTTII